MQRREIVGVDAPRLLIRDARLAQGVVEAIPDERVDRRIHPPDAGDVSLDDLARGRLSTPDRRGKRDRRGREDSFRPHTS